MTQGFVVAKSMVAMTMMAVCDGELTHNALQDLVFIAAVARGSTHAPEQILEDLEQQVTLIAHIPREQWRELLSDVRSFSAEQREHVIFAAARMAHSDGPPNRKRLALLRQMAEWMGFSDREYRDFTAFFAAELEKTRDPASKSGVRLY